MGEVFLAEDTKLRRQVSLKFLSQELTQDETRKQRFIQEARVAAGIEHPHIAAIHDIDEADGRTFIAMEYVRGESLRETINAGKLNLRRSLELGFQVADGLAKAHERGVVHRDIKPENILVSEDGYAKIIDFGLAKLLEPLAPRGDDSEANTATQLKTREGVVMGTVSYMSPEQASGATVDARSDVFSFGIVLYEMLTGESPFRKASLAESLGAVLHTTPPALEAPSVTIPPELQRILKKALAKAPGGSLSKHERPSDRSAESSRGLDEYWRDRSSRTDGEETVVLGCRGCGCHRGAHLLSHSTVGTSRHRGFGPTGDRGHVLREHDRR